MEYNKLVANRIKFARYEANFSSEYVAGKLGKAKSSYSAIENGKTQITVKYLKELSHILNKPVHYFLPELIYDIGTCSQSIHNGDRL